MGEREYKSNDPQRDRLRDGYFSGRDSNRGRYPNGRNPNISYVHTEATEEELDEYDEILFAALDPDRETTESSQEQLTSNYLDPGWGEIANPDNISNDIDTSNWKTPDGRDLSEKEKQRIASVYRSSVIPTFVIASYGTLGSRTLWQAFGQIVARRFGQRAAFAAMINAGDPISPVAELLTLGLAALTIYQIYRAWDELWGETEVELSNPNSEIVITQQPENQVYTTPNGERGRIEHTGSVPPQVETGTPPFDTEAGRDIVESQQNTGGQIRQQPDARDFVMEWSPSMTPAEADEYTKDSYYAGKTFYHGTNVSSAGNIADGGIDSNRFDEYSTYGVGFYLGGERAEAEPYARRKSEETGQSGAILSVRLNVQNPKIYQTSQDYWQEQAEYMRQAGVDYEVEIEVAFTNYLREQGFDAIEFTDLDFYIVFEPEQVVVIGNETIR